MLTGWAVGIPLVSRLWIYGSRVRGDNRAGSDLDIAIELDLSASDGIDESDGLATWMFESDAWAEQLNELFVIRVDLQFFDGEKTPTIQAALNREGELIYVKLP